MVYSLIKTARKCYIHLTVVALSWKGIIKGQAQPCFPSLGKSLVVSHSAFIICMTEEFRRIPLRGPSLPCLTMPLFDLVEDATNFSKEEDRVLKYWDEIKVFNAKCAHNSPAFLLWAQQRLTNARAKTKIPTLLCVGF